MCVGMHGKAANGQEKRRRAKRQKRCKKGICLTLSLHSAHSEQRCSQLETLTVDNYSTRQIISRGAVDLKSVP